MGNVSYKKGSIVYKAGERMKEVGLIVKGSVWQKSQSTSLVLEAGHIIGLAGCDSARYPCDYVAAEDTVICGFDYRAPEDFAGIFAQEKFGSVFILAALKQTSLLLEQYVRMRNTSKELYSLAIGTYRDYKYFCSMFSLSEFELSRMQYLSAFSGQDAIPEWKVQYYKKFVELGLEELKELFTCQELCIGTIEQAGAFMTDLIHGIEDCSNYLEKSKAVLLVEKKNDMFQLLFDLENRVSYISQNKEELRNRIAKLMAFVEKSGIYDPELVQNRFREYEQYDFATCDEEVTCGENSVWEEEEDDPAKDSQLTCLQQILAYAGFQSEQVTEFENKLKQYMEIEDQESTEGEARTLRKWLTLQYYKCYKACVKNALEKEVVSPIINMFLNFGFMDVTFLGGEEKANEILELTDELFACNAENVHTFFDWLKSIYKGENEPSVSELDVSYAQYLKDAVRNGTISSDKVKEYQNDPWSKVEYELDNLFHSGGKVTCGRVTTFCPILSDKDLGTAPRDMLVTFSKIKQILDVIRDTDYSLFYREVVFSDEEKGITREFINEEILPQIILMPNVGSKGMMWQVTAGARNNTPARFMLPILCTGDLMDIMIENCGRYRWEMCRKIQGSRWNDITTPSLTSEYSDYLQYYRKNFDLSAEAKEKIQNTMKRSRNNFREVFVKDYENWIKYEAKGSFRLNKVARSILFSYCPFGIRVRKELKENPMFQEQLNRFNIQNQRKVKRLKALYNRYTEKGGVITPALQANMDFYDL
ncbi:MAG: cyclic nucleotide-binding domain-containing protein [Lachnospiraceae bacterium]